MNTSNKFINRNMEINNFINKAVEYMNTQNEINNLHMDLSKIQEQRIYGLRKAVIALCFCMSFLSITNIIALFKIW